MINFTTATNSKTTKTLNNPAFTRSRFNIFKNLSAFALVMMLGVNGVMGQTTYTLCTSTSDLVAGTKYIVVSSQTNGSAYALGYQNTSNRAQVAVTISSSTVSITPATSNSQTTSVFELTLGGSTGLWTLNDAANSTLIGSTSSSNNYLKANSSATWTISFSSNAAVMTSTGGTNNILRYNSASSLFSCYASGQAAVYLYKSGSATDYHWNGGNGLNNTNNIWDNGTTRNWGITNGASFAANTAPGVVWPASGSYNANFNNAAAATSVSLPAAISVMPNSTVIGTSGYTFAPAVTQTFSSPITLTNSLTIAPAASTVFTMSGIASSTGGLIHNGSGATTISAANTFTTAGFTLTNGTVVVGNANALGAASSPLALNGGTISATGSAFTLANTALTVGGNFQLGEIAGNVSTAGAGNLTFGGTVNLGSSARTITLGNAGNHLFSGVISNTSGGLTFTANNNGLGRFDITNAANTFTGPININGNGIGIAEVRFTVDGSLGNASNTININGGRLATANTVTYSLTSTRGIQVGNTAGTSISTPGTGVLTYNGVISDLSGSTPGAWAKQGGGTLSLGGVSTYTGATAINNGTLQLTTGNDRMPTGTILSLGQASSANLGTFDLNGRNQTIGGLNSTSGTYASTLNNTITSSTAATLTVTGSGSFGDGTSANSGVISGSVALVKSVGGTLTLADANTYTGTTTVSAGTLFVNGSLASGSIVTIDASGTLAGNGTAAGTVSLTGTVSPGGTTSTTANLATGAFTFNANSTYKFEMNNATGAAGNANGWDKITSSGAIICSATPITIDITSVSITNFSGSTSYSWVIAQGTSISGFNAGNFTLTTTNFLPSLAGGYFSISATSTDISLLFNAATPSVITSGTIPNFGTVTVNTTSPSSSFPSYNASGAFLTNDITITPPIGVEVSTSSTFASNIGTNSSPITLAHSGGIVNSTPIYVRFAPTTASGSFSANITNSSSPAPTQNVAITGKAVDTEPTTQTTSISFSSVSTTTMTVNFNTTGNGGKRILVAKAGSAVNSDPVDGTTYTANLAFGSGTQIGTGNYVVVASNASSAAITGLSSGTTYHFALYEYNDNSNTSGAENYYTTTAPTANTTTTTPASTWTGTTSGTWLTSTNWTPSGAPSGVGAEAFFNSNTNAGTNGINMNGISAGNSSIGAIHWGSSATTARTVTNSSGSAGGTFTLNGITVNSVGNTILRNASSGSHNITPGSPELIIGLGNSTENIVNIDGTGNIAISSVISSSTGTTPLTITGSGSGRLDLTNTTNTFTGTITFSGAEARFTAAGSYGNANNTLVIDGGRMATTSATTYTLASTHAIQVGATANTSIGVSTSGTLTYNGIIADKVGSAGAWAKQGAGILALGGISTYTGATAINNGTLQLTTGNDRLPTGTALTIGQASSTNTGTFDLNGRNQTIAGLNSTTGSASAITNVGSNNTINSSTAATLTVNGAGSYGDGTDANSGIIDGSIALTKTGSGTLTLGDANTYTGLTTVSAGTLRLNKSGGTTIPNTNNVTVNGGTLQVSTNQTLNNLIISSGGITIDDGVTLTINGTITYSGGTMNYGSTTTGNLIISNSGSLIVSSGTFSTNGRVTVQSNASGTGSIGNSAGAFSGNITVERYIPANGRRYRFLASPVVGGTTLQWRNGVTNVSGRGIQITGTGTVDASTTNQPSAFYYDETSTTNTGINGIGKWVAIDGSTNLTNGNGYRVFVRGDRSIDLTTLNTTNNATTISVTGTHPTGTISLPVTYTTGAGGLGWNLVGNPYPCSIDFTSVSGWTKTFIGTGVAIYKPSTNSYAYSITNGDATDNVSVSINDGSNIIGSGMAFWVRATASTPVLSCTEAVKVTSAPPTVLLKSAPKNQLRLKLTQDSLNIDETVIAFGDKFSADFLENEDLNKLPNATVNISSIFGNGKYVAINFTSNNYTEKTIPLSVWGNTNGKYQLAFSQVEGFDAGVSIGLKDKFLNTITAVNESKTISIDLNDNSKGDNRFELLFKNNGTIVENVSNTILSIYPNPATDVLNISLSNGTSIETVNIYNVSGKLVNNTKLNGNQIDISQLNNGVYMVEVITANGSFKTKFVK